MNIETLRLEALALPFQERALLAAQRIPAEDVLQEARMLLK